MIRRISLSARLNVAFGLVLALTIAVGAVGIYKITAVASTTRNLYDHPFTVKSSLLDVRDDISVIQADFVSALFFGEQRQLDALPERFVAFDREARKKLDLARERYLGPKQDFNDVVTAYTEWRKEIITLLPVVREGSQQEIVRQYRQGVQPTADRLSYAIQKMIDFAHARAGRFMDEGTAEREQALHLMAFLIVAAVVAGAAASRLVIRSIAVPVNNLVALARELELGHDLQEQPVRYTDEVSRLEQSFNAVIAANNMVVQQARAVAEGSYPPEVRLRSPEDTLGLSLQTMTRSLAQRERENRAEQWLKEGEAELGESMRGNVDLATVAEATAAYLARRLHSRVGCLYLIEGDKRTLRLHGRYACGNGDIPAEIAVGEGLAGQAAKEGQPVYLDSVPPGYLRVASAVGETAPVHVAIVPVRFGEQVIGLVELGSLEEFTELDRQFVERAAFILGQGFNLALARDGMQRLLGVTLKQTDDLRAQQEELAAINEELEEQTQALRASEETLKQQQEELQATNEELEEKTRDIERQRERILEKNRELQAAQQDLEQQAAELERVSRYKSDFLATMSHELRTPLNSILILAHDFTENRDGNLLPEQVEQAQVIYRSGGDLLNLINDILDLSRIESGKLELVDEVLATGDLITTLKHTFVPQARKKGIALRIDAEDGMVERFCSDRLRLEQILNNLISNAIKFTDNGSVQVLFAAPAGSEELQVAVRDTGIGIPQDKLQTVFETFRQADSGTSRRYGGSGLGLPIALNLAGLLGGTIDVTSTPGTGSVFTLRLPLRALKGKANQQEATEETVPRPVISAAPVPDDRDSIGENDRVLLIVEDDPFFAATVRDVCRASGFKTVCALTGEEGLSFARKAAPAAIILDLWLPGMSGLTLLEQLKTDLSLRHIPVHIISADQPSPEAFRLGAIGFLTKPASRDELERSLQNIESVIARSIKELLLVEDDETLRFTIAKLVGNDDIVVTPASTGAEALAALEERRFDCMVLDLGLPDVPGIDLLRRLRRDARFAELPVIVYTGRELTRDEERELREVSESIIIKGARSEERLVDETAIFLHRVVNRLNESQQQYILNLHDRDFYLQGKNVLLVDDDMRNLFALSKVLEQRGLQVTKAESGDRALALLREGARFDIILMDIMMPGTDGYETTRAMRAMGIDVPIIAVTAKAMKEDREKCLEAGANDYLAKPVELDRLMSMMRVWLYA